MERSVSNFLLVLVLRTTLLHLVTSSPLVQAPWGALQGVVVEGDGGRTLVGYLGVPYALPPVGERRWEKPLPHPGLEEGEVFKADKIMPACPQAPMLIGPSREISENCLTMDLYVPRDVIDDDDVRDDVTPWPVMVFFHGGGFIMGDAPSYRPSKLVSDGKVMVAVVQYRLGALGFLTSGDAVLTENLGLWDQVQALRWIKDNVESFGGDPGSITLFGESAGSISAALHMVMPPSKGLFHRVIMESGPPQDVIQFIEMFGRKEVFKGFADLVGCEGEGSDQVLQCLKQQPLDLLMNKSADYLATSPVQNYFFPVIDGDLIPRHPKDLIMDADFVRDNGVGNIDVITGFNQHEGATILIVEALGMLPEETLHTVEFFRSVVDMCFGFTGMKGNDVLKKTIEFFYRGADFDTNVSHSLRPLVDLYGDCLLTVPTIEWARHLASNIQQKRAHHYMYVVDHDFACNAQGLMPGAHHGDELLLLFDVGAFPPDAIHVPLNKTFISEEEETLSAQLVQLWTSFARTGIPSLPNSPEGIEWPEFTVEDQHYLSFSTSPAVKSLHGSYSQRTAFWRTLLPQLQELTPNTQQQLHSHTQGKTAAKEEL